MAQRTPRCSPKCLLSTTTPQRRRVGWSYSLTRRGPRRHSQQHPALARLHPALESGMKLRIGTRGSKLALWQAYAVRDALVDAHGDAVDVEIIEVSTQGDRIVDRP